MKKVKKLEYRCNLNNDPLYGSEYPSLDEIVDKINEIITVLNRLVKNESRIDNR